MRIRQACIYMSLTSAILSFAGCSAWGPESKGDAQIQSTVGRKSLAGMYSDVGSDGSIKPHPESSMTQPKGGHATGQIMLNEPVDMPDIRTGKPIKRATERARPELGSESTGGASGK